MTMETARTSQSAAGARSTLGAIVKLDIEGLAELTVGERLNVKVMGTNAHGIKVDVTAKTDLSSANSSILRVNVGGVIEALGPGSCDLIAIHAGVRALLRLSVKPKDVVLVKLRIEGPNVLKVGQTASLRVFASMSDDTEVDVTGRVIWSSNNLLSLVVDASGLLRALIPGDCLVTGVVDGITTASVKVPLAPEVVPSPGSRASHAVSGCTPVLTRAMLNAEGCVTSRPPPARRNC